MRCLHNRLSMIPPLTTSRRSIDWPCSCPARNAASALRLRFCPRARRATSCAPDGTQELPWSRRRQVGVRRWGLPVHGDLLPRAVRAGKRGLASQEARQRTIWDPPRPATCPGSAPRYSFRQTPRSRHRRVRRPTLPTRPPDRLGLAVFCCPAPSILRSSRRVGNPSLDSGTAHMVAFCSPVSAATSALTWRCCCAPIEATRKIVAQTPHIRVLVLTMFEDDDSVFAALQAGARAATY